MISIYIERRRGKKGIQARVKGTKKKLVLASPNQTYEQKKKGTKRNTLMIRMYVEKYKRKKKGHVTAHTRKK